MISPDSPHACWPVARVLEVYTGMDGFIQSTKVKVSTKEYVRSIVELCPLELHSLLNFTDNYVQIQYLRNNQNYWD